MPRPTVAEIDLSAIRHNLRAIRDHVTPGVEVIGVIKADAYGHGAAPVARALAREGVSRVAVAVVEEAQALRESGIRLRILVLGAAFPDQTAEIARGDFEIVLSDLEFAKRLDRAARRAGKPVAVHLKFDTGMGRIGFSPEQAPAVIGQIRGMSGLRLEGIMTHFAQSDERGGETFTRQQIRAFLALHHAVRAAGIHVPTWHAANSGGAFSYPSAHMDAVRPGIALYGSYPSAEVPHFVDLRPAMTLKTRIAQVRDVPAGASVSYGRTFRAKRPSRIAMLPIGYADGFSRHNSNVGQVLIGGRRAPIAGRICMDMTMVDITDLPNAAPGDEAVLYGRQGEAELPVHEVAATIGTISYEIMTSVGARVRRVYCNA